MSLLNRLFGRRTDPRDAMRPLYLAIVERARTPAWYLDGADDTLDGRFDILTALFAQVLLRLEDAPDTAAASALLTEIFVTDMDGQLRQIGIGDMTVGKHIGRMMAALGGRLTAYREAGGDVAAWDAALRRNLWRGAVPADPDAPARVTARMLAFRAALDTVDAQAILAGQLPEIA